MLKDNKGITLSALVVTIIILLILASIATVSGIEAVNNTKFNNAKAQFQTMQAQANSWYEESKNNAGVLNYGEDLSTCDATIKEQTLNGKYPAGYKYFKADYITDTLDIDGISYDFLINISTGTVLLYGGITYQGRTYYSAEDFGINSVNHTEVSGAITFDTEIKDSNIIVYNIKFPEDVLISKYDVQYKDNKKGDTYWTTLTSDTKKPYTYTNAEGNSITDNNAWYIPLDVQDQDINIDNSTSEDQGIPYIEGNNIEVEIADVTIKIITKSSNIASGEVIVKKTKSVGSEGYVGKIVDETITLRDANEEKVVVPAGFKILEDSRLPGDEAYVKNGIVVQAPDGSEFVWVPVEEINSMVMCQGSTGANNCNIQKTTVDSKEKLVCTTHSNYNICGKLYGNQTGNNFNSKMTNQEYSATSGYREPAYVEGPWENYIPGYENKGIKLLKSIIGLTGTTDDEIKEKWKNQLQKEYDEMAKSVYENKGFYIGRYETSLDSNNNAQSVKNQESATPGTKIDGQSLTWYGLYKLEKNYNMKEYKINETIENTVGSTMIWGSQYDQMMIWMENNEIDITAIYSNIVLQNIYYIWGGKEEITLEASSDKARVIRGGTGSSVCSRWHIWPPYTIDGCSSRISLYIK